MHDLFAELFQYNHWANQKVFKLCDGLTDRELDTPREMGFGTLRRTLFHLFAVEDIWMDRWQNSPWRGLQTDPNGVSVPQMWEHLQQVGSDRKTFLATRSETETYAKIDYSDSRQHPYQHRLIDLMLHVIHHGIHHRAQALSYLKKLKRLLHPGIDYIYFRIAGGSSTQSREAAAVMTELGLIVPEFEGSEFQWNREAMMRCFQYHDWANACVLSWAAELNDEQLMKDHDIGHGDVRSTLHHLYDVERWWLGSLMGNASSFGQMSNFLSVDELTGHWMTLRESRKNFLEQLSGADALRSFSVNFGGPDFAFQVAEGILQIACHGTHHRAQLINMLRHSACDVNNIDLMYALDSLPGSAQA